jgi:hypothetical protein
MSYLDYHFEQAGMYATDGPTYTCSCGEIFVFRDDLIEHMQNEQGTAFTLSYTIGTEIGQSGKPFWGIHTKEGCEELEVEKCKYCKRSLAVSGPDIQCSMSHWQAYNFKLSIQSLPYGGDGVVSTFDLGRAGVGIEREAHTRTLALLKRARNLLTSDSPEVKELLEDIKRDCPVFKEEDDA